MKVRMTTDRAVNDGLGRAVYQFDGEIVELPRPEALALIVARQAEPVDETEKPKKKVSHGRA